MTAPARGTTGAALPAPPDLRFVAAKVANLLLLGTTAALSTGPYESCAAWSDALFDHLDLPDGMLLFGSRYNSAENCVALFERPDAAHGSHDAEKARKAGAALSAAQ